MDGSQEKDHAEELLNAPPRVLLVDDEPGLRTAVQAYFEDEGFIVSTAADGEEGWEKAQSQLPDVVLSDVMMPRVDGFGLLKLLREERLGGTPVIFLTAKGMTADRIASFRAGVDDYIPKPDPDELVVRYATWCSARSACSKKRPATPIPTWVKWPNRSAKFARCCKAVAAGPRAKRGAFLHAAGSQRAAAGGGRADEQGNRPSAGDIDPHVEKCVSVCLPRPAPPAAELVRALEHGLVR